MVIVPTSFSMLKHYFFWSIDLIVEVGTIGFFLLSFFFLRFSLFFGLLSPIATFSFFVDDLNFYIDSVAVH